MGLKGSSTTAVYFDNVRVPVENVLGEVGRGHIVAFNILNIGRLKLGVFAHGGSRQTLADAIRYAKERRAFGKSIAEFGLIQHKLAEMAIRMYVNESMAYRVTGHIQEHLEGFSWESPTAAQTMLKAVEEFAAECSIIKIFGSETLDYVVDEALQIHGGYGYHQDYAVERAYRDSRINRIFEGTNEINRLLVTGMLIKRAKKGRLPVLDSVETPAAADAKSISRYLLSAAHKRFGDALDQEQEVVAGITDVLMSTFAMESAMLRARKCNRQNALDMAAVFADEAMEQIESSARTVLAACLEGDALKLAAHEPANTICIRRRIATRLIQSGRYVV